VGCRSQAWHSLHDAAAAAAAVRAAAAAARLARAQLARRLDLLQPLHNLPHAGAQGGLLVPRGLQQGWAFGGPAVSWWLRLELAAPAGACRRSIQPAGLPRPPAREGGAERSGAAPGGLRLRGRLRAQRLRCPDHRHRPTHRYQRLDAGGEVVVDGRPEPIAHTRGVGLQASAGGRL